MNPTRTGRQCAAVVAAALCCGAVTAPAASADTQRFRTGAIFSCFGAQPPFAGLQTSSSATISSFAAPGFTAIVNLSGAPPFGARPNTQYFLQLYSSGCGRTGFTFVRTNFLGNAQGVIHVDDPFPPITHNAFAVASGGGQFLVTPQASF